VNATQDLLENARGQLRVLAEVAAADSNYFRTEQAAICVPRPHLCAHIDAIYVSFEAGIIGWSPASTRTAGTRYALFPASANALPAKSTAISFAVRRTRHPKFFDIWPHEVGNYDVAPRTEYSHCRLSGAKDNAALAVTGALDQYGNRFPILS